MHAEKRRSNLFFKKKEEEAFARTLLG